MLCVLGEIWGEGLTRCDAIFIDVYVLLQSMRKILLMFLSLIECGYVLLNLVRQAMSLVI